LSTAETQRRGGKHIEIIKVFSAPLGSACFWLCISAVKGSDAGSGAGVLSGSPFLINLKKAFGHGSELTPDKGG
jgi:hypothetical protein